MRTPLFVALLVLTSLGLTACKAGEVEPTDDSRTEGDADADSDADSDTDADADSDADSDTDADGDADSDAQEEDCLTSGDEDQDGLADCQDPDCSAHCAEDCANLTDDDADGDIDCADDDCAEVCVEDCDDTLDNDQDGLADCADDDCLDLCIEDCSDTVDNDVDGAIDCDDDECQGVAGCPTRYTLEARVGLDYVLMLWGTGLDYVYGVYAGGLMTGVVNLYGAPTSASGSSFACSGAFFAFAPPYGPYFGELDYVGGACDGCDLRFEMTSTTANGGLQWWSACPVSELPVAQVGFYFDQYQISRYDPTSASWGAQYSAAYGKLRTFNVSGSGGGGGKTYAAYMYSFIQLDPVVWEVEL